MRSSYSRSREALDEVTVKMVLLRNKGDLILSAGEMCIRPSTLVNWIRSVPSVKNLWDEMEALKADTKFEAATAEQFAKEIANRAAIYRLDGLEVLHELATEDHDGVSAMAEIRLKAAIALRGATDYVPTSGNNVLAELNTLYHANAPRIKSMRAVQIEFADEPASLPISD